MKAKKGISLIVLVITIIVIIILAGAVILNLSKNNPMDSAKVASLTSSRESLESAATLYLTKAIAATNGDYSASDIFKGQPKTDQAAVGSTLPAAYASYGSIVTATTKTIGSITAYTFDTTAAKAALDMSIPTVANAVWCVDINTGKCYLVYDNAQHYPTYMGTKPALTGTPAVAPYYPANSTLAGFVAADTNVAL